MAPWCRAQLLQPSLAWGWDAGSAARSVLGVFAPAAEHSADCASKGNVVLGPPWKS